MEYPFHIFGSQSSLDYDVVVVTSDLGTTHENFNFCQEQALLLTHLFSQKGLPVKKINMNTAVIADGIIQQVYKGTPDELNNAVVHTYPLHTQFYPLLVNRKVERNWQLKMIRTCRTILSFYTRTPLRRMIKQALQSDLDAKIRALEDLNLTEWTELNKNVLQDCWKTIAFQLGQALGLLEGSELYTKEAIEMLFPDLRVFLHRQATTDDLKILETKKQQFIDKMKMVRPQFSKLTEQEWTSSNFTK